MFKLFGDSAGACQWISENLNSGRSVEGIKDKLGRLREVLSGGPDLVTDVNVSHLLAHSGRSLPPQTRVLHWLLDAIDNEVDLAGDQEIGISRQALRRADCSLELVQAKALEIIVKVRPVPRTLTRVHRLVNRPAVGTRRRRTGCSGELSMSF